MPALDPGGHQHLLHDPEAERDAAWARRVDIVAPGEVGVRVADARDEGPQQAQELVPRHPLVWNAVQHPVQAPMEGNPATAVQVRIGVRALEDVGELSGILDQLLTAEGTRLRRDRSR